MYIRVELINGPKHASLDDTDIKYNIAPATQHFYFILAWTTRYFVIVHKKSKQPKQIFLYFYSFFLYGYTRIFACENLGQAICHSFELKSKHK